VSRAAFLFSTPSIHGCYLGPHSRIESAADVADCIILSSREDPTEIGAGACVSGSVLQWGSRVGKLACVDRSFLAEHSHVGGHAKVASSVIGPNSSVERGEVISSLVGPFVSMHHESLLISALWPEGRGNISYGVMAGANHTTKAPDQEFKPGEG